MDQDELKGRCRRFSFDVVGLVLAIGTDDLARTVRPQLIRSATGVTTNYRAACRGRSRREFIARLGVVAEEADETEFWLDLLDELKREPRGQVLRLRAESQELRAIFAASRRSALERRPANRRGQP